MTSFKQTATTRIYQRFCGWPIVGSIYLNVPTDANGDFYGKNPFFFALCPTQYVDVEGMGISPLGMKLILRTDGMGTPVHDSDGKEIYDIWDWIGEGKYRNPHDWLFEVSQLGLHQLIERTTEFSKLSSSSYYYAVHKRAGIMGNRQYYEEFVEVPPYHICPKDIGYHNHPTPEWLDARTDIGTDSETCIKILLNDIVDGTKVEKRIVRRTLPCGKWYDGASAPVKDKEHYVAAFYKFPIGRVGKFLVYQSSTNKGEDALKALEALDAKLQRVQTISID
jgi:hypothetical protein